MEDIRQPPEKLRAPRSDVTARCGLDDAWKPVVLDTECIDHLSVASGTYLYMEYHSEAEGS